MDIYMDNYGYMRFRKTGKIYNWQVKSPKYICILINMMQGFALEAPKGMYK